MENRKIIKKIVYSVNMLLASPLSVSSGDDTNSKSDLQRNFDGEKVFIPGSSLIGAMRAFVEKSEQRELFGYSDEKENVSNCAGKQSPIAITDFVFCKDPVISIRDRVKLEEKVAVDKAKFDLEIVEPGVRGEFRIVLTIREKDNEKVWTQLLNNIFSGIENGEIRFGADKNRGFGRFSELKVLLKEYSAENWLDWLVYSCSADISNAGFNKLEKKIWYSAGYKKYAFFEVPLKLRGGISIRKYAVTEDIDFEHISCNGKYIVPGTSWAGAIRNRALQMLEELDIVQRKQIIDKWFGCVNVDKNQSKIIIEESIFSDGNTLHMTRNRINRFSAATINGALFSEKSYYQGKTKLRIWVSKENNEWKAIMGLLCFVVKDIVNGFLPVGGQTGVGRGIFEKNGDSLFSEESEEYYIKELADYLGGNGEYAAVD